MKHRNYWWDRQPREGLRRLIAWWNAQSPSAQLRLLDDADPTAPAPAGHAELSPMRGG